MGLSYHSSIIKNDGTVWSCGYNNYGQLGLGDNTNRTTFTKINIDDIKNIYYGKTYALILKNDGTVWSCGYNNAGQLGLGDTTDRNTFTKVNIDNVKSIACGSSYVIILKNDGTVWSCGDNAFGQLGLGDATQRNTFTKINIDNVKSVASGSNYSVILKNDDTIWICGHNSSGQLGLNDTTSRSTFTKVNIDNVKAISCGGAHTFILKNDGTVWSCGYNNSGQLGFADTNNRSICTKVDIDNVKYISCGNTHTIILKKDGTIWSCGYNNYGQLGLSDVTNRNTLTKVDIDNVKDISCGYNHTFILKNDGTVWSCGYGEYGQLGLGNITDKTTFTKVDIDNVKQLFDTGIIEEIIKYIIKSIQGNYTISNDLLTSISEDVTSDIIMSLGTSLEDININLSLLPDEFSLVTNKQNPITINGLQDNTQMMVASSDFLTKIQSNIDYFKGEYIKSESSQIKIVFSIDGGITWKIHDGIDFKDLVNTLPLKDYNLLNPDELIEWNNFKQEIITNGIDASLLSGINFNTLDFDKIRFAYVLNINSYEDILVNKNLLWQFDSKGTMNKLKDTDYDLALTNDEIVFSPFIDADMIKLEIVQGDAVLVEHVDVEFATIEDIDSLFIV